MAIFARLPVSAIFDAFSSLLALDFIKTCELAHTNQNSLPPSLYSKRARYAFQAFLL